MTLNDYLDKHYRPATARLYAFEIDHYLNRIGGEQAALKTGYTELVDHLERLRQRYDNPATLNRILCSIKSYYRYLVASGKREDHPGKNIILRDAKSEDIQVQDLLNERELAKLLEPKNERYRSLKIRNQVVIGLLINQALLVSEIVNLRPEDIDLESTQICIWGSERNRRRQLPLAAEQIIPLHRYLHEIRTKVNKQDHQNLILTSRGSVEKGEGIHYLIETLRPRIPHKKLTPTSIRQSVIAQKLKQGEDLRKVQVFAGHRKISTTEKHRQTNLEELRRAVADFHPLQQKGNHFNH